MWPKSWERRWTAREKKTRAFKKKLTAKQRKEFRSCLWAFRRRPADLSEEQGRQLEKLFLKIPELEGAYYIRWGITEVFDTAEDQETAAEQLEEYRDLLEEGEDEELLEFFASYDAHRDGILAYFCERKSSGVVEGLNNKARVVTKRCYGLKKAKSLWDRLCLDVNLARRAMGQALGQIKSLVKTIRATFLAFYT